MGLVELLENVPGQQRVIHELQAHLDSLRNSYFFLGPVESGVIEIARAFAQAIVCSEGGCGTCVSCIAIANNLHPDVAVFERVGAALTVDEAKEITSLAFRTTSGSDHRVIIVPELELIGKAGPVLLKTVEEPPQGTIFILQASTATPELATLMSRSLVIELDPLPEDLVVEFLISSGVSATDAHDATVLSGGRLARAMELARDVELRDAFVVWREVPEKLSGDISAILALADQLLETVSRVEGRRKDEHKKELKELDATIKALGISKSDMRDAVEARHKKELRRLRTTELRYGLLLVEREFRNNFTNGRHSTANVKSSIRAIRVIEDAQQALRRNANEFLILVALLSRLVDSSG